jgi:hypothetical protein
MSVDVEPLRVEVLAGPPRYILTRYLEDGGDRWIGPFAPTIPMACMPGGRVYFFKSEVANQTSAGTCPGGGAPHGGEPVTMFTFRV